MVNESIIGGLKSAVARGQSLQKAYYSLINAGYNKSEVDEAFATLTMPVENSNVSKSSLIIKQQMDLIKPTLPPISLQKNILQQNQTPNNLPQFQKVFVPPANKFSQISQQNQGSTIIRDASEYSSQKKQSNAVAIALMVLILIFLMGILFGVVIFKEEILQLLG